MKRYSWGLVFVTVASLIGFVSFSGFMQPFTAFARTVWAGQRVRDKAAANELRRKTFANGRELLLKYGVPFDPDILLDDNWPKILRTTFDSMPEFQIDIYGGDVIQGVVLARDLYLPEKVTAKGHTIIIVRRMIFEGRSPEIKGVGGDLVVFPIESVERYGLRSAEIALQRRWPVSVLPHQTGP